MEARCFLTKSAACGPPWPGRRGKAEGKEEGQGWLRGARAPPLVSLPLSLSSPGPASTTNPHTHRQTPQTGRPGPQSPGGCGTDQGWAAWSGTERERERDVNQNERGKKKKKRGRRRRAPRRPSPPSTHRRVVKVLHRRPPPAHEGVAVRNLAVGPVRERERVGCA